MVTIGSELPPGTLVDRRYQIKCVLGRGGFGRTYLASDQRRFGELCVLKEFVPKNQGDSIVVQKLHELFQREAQILHKLNHPQIPKFFAVFEENDRLFIAQEYITGKTYWRLLQERQQRGTAFSEVEVFHWLRYLLPVLEYLHRQNIVHRDISPDNVMLPRNGRLPVLIDFGVVKQSAPQWYEFNTINSAGDSAGLIEASVSVGKLGYAPYEQIRIGQCSPRSDLYALAVTAVVLLTAKTPNLLIDPKSLEWKWQTFVNVRPQFAAILVKMMAEKPQDRYPSARAVLEDLDALNQQLVFGSRSARQLRERAASTIRQAIASPPKSQAPSPALRQSASSSRRRLPAASALPYPPPTRSTAPQIQTHNQAATLIPTASSLRKSCSGDPTVKLLADTPATKLTVLANSLDSTKRPLKQALVLGCLLLFPLGMAVAVQSPQISLLCQSLNNCAGDADYQRIARQAEKSKVLLERATTLEDLQAVHHRLSKALAQFSALSSAQAGNQTPIAHRDIAAYRALLQRVEQRLEKEAKAVELLQRAENEAKMAEQQTIPAKTLQQLTLARSQWRKALATLSAIPSSAYVAEQAVARSQQYNAQLQTIDQQLAAINPRIEPSIVPPLSAAKPTVSVSSSITPSAALPASAAGSSPSPVAAASPSRPTATTRSTAQPSPAPASLRANPIASAAELPAAPTPTVVAANRPQQRGLPVAMNRFLSVTQPITPTIAATPSTVKLAAAQTLNEVSVRLNGARISSRGTFVTNVQVENRSDRSFGFVPLFVEVRDANGQAVASRLRLNSSRDGIVAPGETLQGEMYLLDRHWDHSGSQELTLVIREGTSGNRNFHLRF